MNLRRIRPRLPAEQWRRNRLAINIAAALIFAGFTFVMPFLPLYVRDLGVQGDAAIATWSGLLITVAPLLAALLAPAWGRLGDRFGMKLMVERATLAMAIHWGLFAFAQDPYHLLALRILLGAFGGFGTLAMPLLIATTPKEHASRSIGLLQTVQMVSAAVGPIAGGTLADWIGIRNACLVSAGLGLASLCMIHLLYREGEAADGVGDRPKRRATLRQAVALPSFGPMITVIFFVSFVERSFAPIVPLYVLQLGIGESNVAKMAGLIISMGLLSEAAAATFLGGRLRKRSPRRILIWRLGAGVLLCFPMGLVAGAGQLLGLRVMLGLAAGGSMVVIYTVGSLIIPPESRGASFAFLSSAALLGGAVGPMAAGALTHLNIRAIFFFNSLIFVVLLALAWRAIPSPAESAPQVQ